MSFEHLVGTSEFPTTLVTLSLQLWIYRLVLHWYIKGEVFVQMRTFMNYSARWRSKEVLVSTSDFTHLTFRQNRVVIVSSVIAKIFNPSKCWTVTIWLPLNDTLFNQCLLLFIANYLLIDFDSVLYLIQCSYSMQCYCSIWFFCSVFVLFGKCSVLILEMCLRYFNPINIKHQAVNKHHYQTVPSFVLVQERVAYYNHRHYGTEPIFSNG